jgi:2-polyprenyl-6-methoxyphenol hydroxylase-like FAD-dependent oxidoreductase
MRFRSLSCAAIRPQAADETLPTSGRGYDARMAQTDTEVVVIGGGAVGLTVGLELGWRGRSAIVLDEGDGTIEHPRTGGISLRTMEHCRRWGIADEVRNNRFRSDFKLDTVFCTSLTGFELARAERPSMQDTPAPPESPERKVRCPQFWFDPMLSRAARSYDTVRVEYFTRVDSFEARPDGGTVVTAHDVRTGETRQYCGQYVIGCDGPASGVRESLGIGMSGIPLLNYSVNVLFSAPDMIRQSNFSEAERFIFVTPEGTWGNITVVDGRGLWRLTVIGSEERLDLDSFDAGAYLTKAFGRDGFDFDVHSVKPWRRTQLVADQYQVGTVYLCGDAIHTMSPTGGFGVNTGIGDAVDLGWKLDAVLSGWGGPQLLDSYEIERRPVGLRNAGAATRNFKGWSPEADLSLILDDTDAGEAARKEVGAALLAGTHAEWESIGVILGYRYEDSPICVPDGTPPTPDDFAVYVPTARPGARAPHAHLPDGSSTLDLYGRGFTLVHPAAADRDVVARMLSGAGAARVPARAAEVPDEICALYEATYTLVRPDGHVAWRGSDIPARPGAVWDVVRGAG